MNEQEQEQEHLKETQIDQKNRNIEARQNVTGSYKTKKECKWQHGSWALKVGNNSGVEDVSFNIIKKCFGVLFKPLIYLFQQPLEQGVFPDDLKIVIVTSIYKAGDSSDISNYRPISVLPCFSKILERSMYNHLYKYLKESNILYEKQFTFQSGYSTNNAIFQLVDKIFDSFEKEQSTLGVFIGLSKAFDRGDHSMLLKKLKLYAITDKNLAWFES